MIKKRLLAFLIDLLVITILYIVIEYIIHVYNLLNWVCSLLYSLPFVYLFCRDCFTGRSIGKRILNISVIDKNSGESISPLKSCIRNVFIIIWPIDLIVLFATKESLQDKSMNSKVVDYKKVHSLSYQSFLIFMVLWTILFVIIFYLANNGLSSLLFG